MASVGMIKPYKDCTFVAVAWNEEVRAPRLTSLAKEWFLNTVVGVQQSTDNTLVIVRSTLDRPTDNIIKHPHYGFGDASMHDLLSRVRTPWTFVVAFDELPDLELLESIPDAIKWAEGKCHDALWINFNSIVEGVGYDEQHGHLRLFKSSLGWPQKLHSRPVGRSEAWWSTGRIDHERSLDEMMRDYLRYYAKGKGDKGWDTHNKLMMHDACTVIAESKGWDFVKSHEWWPQVEAIAF
jgi:hypothetical protein